MSSWSRGLILTGVLGLIAPPAEGRPATCPAPAPTAPTVPPDVPEPGCPVVTHGRCTARCMPSMTHLVFTYDRSPVVTVTYLLAMVALAAGDGWIISSRPSAHALIVLARRGHDDMSFVLALDRPPAIEITFAPG